MRRPAMRGMPCGMFSRAMIGAVRLLLLSTSLPSTFNSPSACSRAFSDTVECSFHSNLVRRRDWGSWVLRLVAETREDENGQGGMTNARVQSSNRSPKATGARFVGSLADAEAAGGE